MAKIAQKRYERIGEFKEFIDSLSKTSISNDKILGSAESFVKDGIINIFERGTIESNCVTARTVNNMYTFTVCDENSRLLNIKTYYQAETTVYCVSSSINGSSLLYIEIQNESVMEELKIDRKDILRIGK